MTLKNWLVVPPVTLALSVLAASVHATPLIEVGMAFQGATPFAIVDKIAYRCRRGGSARTRRWYRSGAFRAHGRYGYAGSSGVMLGIGY